VNKSGSLLDGMQIIIILFAMAFIIIMSFFVLNEFKEKSGDRLDNTASQYALLQGENTLLGFDGLFVFILIGLILATIIGAYFINTNPIIFWVSIILLFIFITISGILSNVFEQVVADDVLNASAANYPAINYVMGNIPIVILVIFALTAIALWAKWRGV